jgi:hypothetical protein
MSRDPLLGVPTPKPKPRQAHPQSPAPDAEIRRRQRQRSIIMALMLGGFVILVYAISVVRMSAGQ